MNVRPASATLSPVITVYPRLRFWIALLSLAYLLRFAIMDLGWGRLDVSGISPAQPSLIVWGFFALLAYRIKTLSYQVTLGGVGLSIFLIAFALLALLSLETNQAGIGLGAGLVAVFLFHAARTHPDLRPLAYCFAAICGHFLIAPAFFVTFLEPILFLDAALIQAAVAVFDLPIDGGPSGFIGKDDHRIVLIGACSSFNGISLAILVHITWALLLRDTLGKRDAIAVVFTFVLATALNILRITLSAYDAQSYAFWHGASGQTPLGAQIIWYAHHAILLSGGFVSAFIAAPKRGKESA